MIATPRLLLIAPRITETGLQLLTAARGRGLRAHTATGWSVPPELADLGLPTHLYGGPLFADAVGRELGLAVLEPPEDWPARLPVELTGRRIVHTTLAAARELSGPAFVKPPGDKAFAARVYPDGAALPGPELLPGETPVLVSEVVAFAAEYRLFVLDGVVLAASRYAVAGELDVAPLAGDPLAAAALGFAGELLRAVADGLPSAVVVDVGQLADGRWAVVEANPAWASGGYAADPERVLDVVLRAAGPAVAARPSDLAFGRALPAVLR
ncbi:ATP-grasp domain-containing protein [Kitasatospora sp. LaBMicrA B282]|uniref:ATP-grasp domain-containing protein n=1 Tax=Kitasatospora sp. LaBMicrA B282 TaxID=3420949 RepID=UPI003D0B3830